MKKLLLKLLRLIPYSWLPWLPQIIVGLIFTVFFALIPVGAAVLGLFIMIFLSPVAKTVARDSALMKWTVLAVYGGTLLGMIIGVVWEIEFR